MSLKKDLGICISKIYFLFSFIYLFIYLSKNNLVMLEFLEKESTLVILSVFLFCCESRSL